MTRIVGEDFVNGRRGVVGKGEGVGRSLAAPAGNQVNRGMNDTHHLITMPFC